MHKQQLQCSTTYNNQITTNENIFAFIISTEVHIVYVVNTKYMIIEFPPHVKNQPYLVWTSSTLGESNQFSLSNDYLEQDLKTEAHKLQLWRGKTELFAS